MNGWTRFKVIGFSVFLMLFVYLCTLEVPPGWYSYVLALPAIVMLALSSLAHISDIHCDQVGSYWDVRRNGTILAGMVAVLYLFSPLISTWPSWREVAGLWSFALVWITSDGRVPWMRLVWRGIDATMPHRVQHPRRPNATTNNRVH